MNKKTNSTEDDEMLPEYDLSKMGPYVRGKYYVKYPEGTIRVLLATDTAKAFGSGAEVNEVLRLLIRIGQDQGERHTEFDFSKFNVEPAASDLAESERIVRSIALAPDVAIVFKDEKSVNETLRLLIRIAESKAKAA